MSVMGDKGQPPPPWQYPMYNGYHPHPYQQYPSYEPQHFYNYYHGAIPFGTVNGQQEPVNHMVHGGMKPFTPGGQLQPFSQKEQEPEREGGEELPPLPPGPPPASPPAGPFFPQPNPGAGPIRFNMNRPQRPQFNHQGILFNNSGASKKKRKKKNKQNNQFMPPLPPHQMIRPQPPPPPQSANPPPLPPGPPPAAPLPPPEDTAPVQPLTRPLGHNANALDVRAKQHDWPKELSTYINRSYAKCQNDVDKDRVSIILKGKILRATNDDTLWIKDWDNEPLPLTQSEMDNLSVQPAVLKLESAMSAKKRLSTALTSRLGQRSRSRSPHKPRPRSPPRSRRRKDRSNSSESENDWTPPPTTKKGKMRNLEHNFTKGKGKKGKGRGHFYSEFGETSGEVPVNSEMLEKRAARFNNGSRRKSAKLGASASPTNANSSLVVFEDTAGDFELEDCHIVGVCRDIEKSYLRLTTAPEAGAVRPPEVLKQSLSYVKDRWKQNQDYHYACEQLKSIRQDLTVQGIRDTLTVSVYETHARIALERGDHAEFNQCQSQLKLLYSELPAENRAEFTAYRILYFIFTKENMDLNTVMTSLSAEDRSDECVSHALEVRSAWALGNYHRLFCLYRSAPRMSSYLMDWFLPRERKLALKTVVKAYRQTLPVSFLTQELAFQSEPLCQEFLSQFGVIYADDERTKIDCKASAAVVAGA